jgi:hypothetical protein
VPGENSAGRNGLSLHAARVAMDREGGIILRFDRYIGNVIVSRAARLPFAVRLSTNTHLTQDRFGQYRNDLRFPQNFEAVDDRNRRYAEVDMKWLKGRPDIWLGLTPLVPVKPGEPLPHEVRFAIRMNVMELGSAIDVLEENLPMTIALPHKPAAGDLKAIYDPHPSRKADWLGTGYADTFHQASLFSRAFAWLEEVHAAEQKASRFVALPQGQYRRELIRAKKPGVYKALRTYAYWTKQAVKAWPARRRALEGSLSRTRQSLLPTTVFDLSAASKERVRSRSAVGAHSSAIQDPTSPLRQ